MNNTTAKSSTKRQFKLPFGVHNWHKHPMVLPVTVFFVLFFFGLGMFVSVGATTLRSNGTNIVTITMNGEKQVMPTRAETVGDLLERLEIEIDEKDVVEPSTDTLIEDNFRINIYKSRALVIVDEGESIYIESAEPEPRDVIKEAGIDVHPEDIVERDVSEPIGALDALQEGLISERIIIRRSIPIMLNLFGVDYELRTHANTVEELLVERGVDVANISVLPELHERLSEEEAVFVTDPDKEIVMEEEPISPPTEYTDDDTLMTGQTRLKTQGEDGRKVVVYEIGDNDSRSVLQEVIVTHPKPRIIIRGTKPLSRSNDAILYDLRMCESGGNYQINTGNGFYGAYQFMISTWDRVAPMAGRPDLVGVRPDLASPADQDFMVIENAKLSAGGFHSQHPGCSRSLNLPKFPN